jgi:hypothetical protein
MKANHANEGGTPLDESSLSKSRIRLPVQIEAEMLVTVFREVFRDYLKSRS